MLCYVMHACMLCYVMLCYAMLCYVMLCYACMHACMHVYTYIYICVCVRVCINLGMYAYIYTHIAYQGLGDIKWLLHVLRIAVVYSYTYLYSQKSTKG